MKAVSLVILMLSNQGYWFGGHESSVAVRWTVNQPLPDTVVAWSLMFGKVRMADGRVALASGHEPGRVTITVPKVRVRTTLRWTYRLERKDNGQTLAEGERPVYVFPDTLTQGIRERVGAKKVMVLDAAGSIRSFLDKCGISYERMDRLAQLQFARTDLALVAEDQVGKSVLEQEYLVEQARRGAGVLILRQTQAKSVAGYPLARRLVPGRLEWRMNHPLLRELHAADVQSWLEQGKGDLWAVALPADEPVLELAFWPREVPGKTPVPLDALLAVKSVGDGRLVWCQIPLGSWRDDPRAQVFLANAFDYLMTHPEPTLRPSERGEKNKVIIIKPPSTIKY